ncbi:hypothetical protein L226DRAFT_556770 [Lentinus tigrinus ALCF2SS1-7]|uniref:Uncharacterized protein n=1 Tax=Lentinus tigrinus ALCF2SS1-6 TaxID=1328759 RepID=A0A5C2SUB5_9APHY|nr:hypothetical protein L227DRAFT_618959 [Lentinus tigrinus ALCF2SS1-6]RPD80941.1 hypothetical protein L226DRAFT_556770 [Lentinus tigrinus ALCF2SS1-7]
MLNRVLSRPFFYNYKRGSQSDPPGKPPKGDPQAKEDRDTSVRTPGRASNAQTGDTGTHRASEDGPHDLESENSKQDTSGSFILVNNSDTAIKPEDEEVDEEFKTPVLDTADDALSATESSTTDYGVPFFPPVVSPAAASPSHSQESLAFNVQPSRTGILSDISEAEESSVCDVYGSREGSPNPDQLPVPSPDGPKRELSFASFGSSYPSSSPFSVTKASSEVASPQWACGGLQPTADAVLQSPSSTPMSRPPAVGVPSTPRNSLLDTRVQTPDPALTNSDAVANVVPLSSTLQAVAAAGETLRNDNLEGRSPVRAPDTDNTVGTLAQTPILPSPPSTSILESVRAGTESCGSIPSPGPTAAGPTVAVASPEDGGKNLGGAVRTVVDPPATHRWTGPPHTADRPNWALAPEEQSPSTNLATATVSPSGEGKDSSSVSAPVIPPALRKRTGPPHTADRPNWALAPDQPAKPKSSRGRPSRGSGRSWARGSNAIPLGSRNRGHSWASGSQVSGANEELVSETSHCISVVAPEVVSSVADDTTNHPNTRDREKSAGRIQDGPAQWLEHIDTWLAESAQASPASQPNVVNRFSLTPDDHRRNYSEASVSGCNPEAPAWQPASTSPISTTREARLASPYTNTDVERLRRMLRNSGIQSSSSGGPRLHRKSSPNFGSPAKQSSELKGRDSVRVACGAPAGTRIRAVQIANHFEPFRPSPEDIYQPQSRYPAPTPLSTLQSTPKSVLRSSTDWHPADHSFTNTPSRRRDNSQSSPSYSFREQSSVRSFAGMSEGDHDLPPRPESFATPGTRRSTRRLTAEPMRG